MNSKRRPSASLRRLLIVCVGAVVSFGRMPTVVAQDSPATKPQSVWSLKFSNDGKWVAAASGWRENGGGFVVWRTTDWTPQFVHREETGCADVDFSPDSSQIAFCSSGPDSGVIEVGTWRLIRRFASDATWMQSIEFSPDGLKLATAGFDKTIKIWDAQSGELLKTLTGHTDRIHDASFSPNGRLLISCSSDQTSRIWDLSTGEVIRTIHPNDFVARHGAFSSDGTLFYASRFDGEARVQETETGLVRAVFRPANQTSRLSQNGKWMATASGWNDEVDVFRADFQPADDRLRAEIATLIKQFENEDYDVREKATARLIQIGLPAEPYLREAMASTDAEVRLRTRHARKQIMSPKPVAVLGGHTGDTDVLRFSHDDKLLVTGCRGGSIKLWEVGTWKHLRDLSNPLSK